MTEVFEIGVSLALQDGVSEAITKARNDVAALEQVVHESGVSLKALRETGARAASVAFEPVRRVAQTPVPRVEREGAPVAPSALLGVTQAPQGEVDLPEVPAGLVLSGGRNVDTGAPKTPAPTQKSSSGVTSNFVLPAAADALEPSALQLARVPAPQILAETADRSASAPAGGEGPKVALGMHDNQFHAPLPLAAPPSRRQASDEDHAPLSLLNALQFSGVMAFPQPDNQFASRLPSEAGAGSRVGGQIVPQNSGGMTAIPQPANQAVAPTSDFAEAGEDVWSAPHNVRDVTARQAPISAPKSYGGAPLAVVGGSADRASNTPQATEAREAGPREGDVFLDGMLVGRWMSKFLNREAGRASAGPTGFDARRGRLLPGVTVGG